MATLQAADGRILRTRRPLGVDSFNSSGGLMPSSFPPMWSDGERWGPNGPYTLKSFSEIYRSQPVVAGVIDMIASRASTLPFAAFTPEPNGARTPVSRDDSLATLLRRPRPRMATVHMLSHIFTSLCVHGNALVAKLRGPSQDDPPIMLWPLDWGQIAAYGEAGGDIEWWSTTQFGSQEAFIAVEDTIHFAWPSPEGGQVGVSPLEKLGVTIRTEDAAQRYQTANFSNGSRFSSVVTLDEDRPSKEMIARADAAISALHKGVDQAGRTLFIGARAKMQPISMSPVEAALIDQRRVNREEVAILFGLSGPSLTDSTNSALGNVAERFRAFYRDVLPPWTTLVVETFESQLLDTEPGWMERVVRFDFTDKLRGEPRELAESLKLKIESGLMSRNEARTEAGYPPDGDPKDPNNPANKLTMNVNNQAPIDEAPPTAPNVPLTSRE